MIKVNLLGKKKTNSSFSIEEKLSVIGVKPGDFDAFKPIIIKLVAVGIGVYAAGLLPTYFYDKKLAAASAVLKDLEQQQNELQGQLAKKKDLRKQMEQLNKDEAEMQRQISTIEGISRNRSLAFRALDLVVASLPQKVWFEHLTYGNRRFGIKGFSWEYFAINDYIKQLNESAQFGEVNYKGVKAGNTAGPLVPGIPEAAQRVKLFDVDFVVKETVGER